MHVHQLWYSQNEIDLNEQDIIERSSMINPDYVDVLSKDRGKKKFDADCSTNGKYCIEDEFEKLIQEGDKQELSFMKGYYYKEAGALLEGLSCTASRYYNIDEDNNLPPEGKCHYIIIDFHF